MSDWQVFCGFAAAGIAVAILYKIFQEVRSIRRMMNRDRDIPPD